MNPLIIALLLLGTDPSGQIRGHVHFPACMPPTDLQVCAERTDGFARCTTELEWTAIGLAYALDVPPGRYFVYSASERTRPGYRAYFTKAVTCGLRVGCDDHTPIPIDVRAHQTVHEIDPDDWFAPLDERPPAPEPVT